MRHLPLHLAGSRAFLLGIGKDAQALEAGALDEIQKVLEFLLRLTGIVWFAGALILANWLSLQRPVQRIFTRQLDAAAKLSLGSYDRIALQLPGNPLGLARDEAVIEQAKSTRTALLSANVAGSSLCLIDVAGSFGRDLAGQGEKAMVAFATEWLTKLFGSDLALKVAKSSVTNWNASPLFLGAMSVAAPGGQASRKILTEPMGNLFLAGEASHETLWGTVDGAWESGERAAEAALRKIGALNEPLAAPARAPAPRRRTRGASVN